MSEITGEFPFPYSEFAPEQIKDLSDLIGAFEEYDKQYPVSINQNVSPKLTTIKTDLQSLLPNFNSLEIYDRLRTEFIDDAPSGSPKHQAE